MEPMTAKPKGVQLALGGVTLFASHSNCAAKPSAVAGPTRGGDASGSRVCALHGCRADRLNVYRRVWRGLQAFAERQWSRGRPMLLLV
jgi:hypothetical protein